MTEIATWQFNAYHETPEHAALVAAEMGVASTPPPPPITIAREQLSRAVRNDGFLIDFNSITEESRQAVIVDDGGNWRPTLEGEVPTGHIVHWSCSAHQRAAAEDEVLPSEVSPDGRVTASVTPILSEHGGGGRIIHNLDAPVIVKAFDSAGEPIGYMFASELDSNVVHVEFFSGTAVLTVEASEKGKG